MKMVVAMHDSAFALPDAVLTKEVMLNVLHKFHLQHRLKETWTKNERLMYEKMFNTEGMKQGSRAAETKDESMKKS